MTTFLDLLNDAREDLGSDRLSALDISSDASESRDGISACNKAWDTILGYSVDLQFSNEIVDMELNDASDEPVLPEDVDIDLIKWIKNKNSTGTGYYNLKLVIEERGVEMEGINPSEGMPVFYYIHKNVLKVIPAADKAYTLKICYQKEPDRLTSANMTSEVPFSRKWNRVFVNGVYAFLKQKARHSDADTAYGLFRESLKLTSKHLNKWNKKREGILRYSTRGRNRPKKIF
jgi:hypothetical protein